MASSVGLKDAQEHLGELLDRVERGEEIIIERDGRAVSKLVPVGDAEQPKKQSLLDSARGEIWLADDWDSVETNREIEELFEGTEENGRRVLGAGRGELRVPSEGEWHEMDQELSWRMNNSPLLPDDATAGNK